MKTKNGDAFFFHVVISVKVCGLVMKILLEYGRFFSINYPINH